MYMVLALLKLKSKSLILFSHSKSSQQLHVFAFHINCTRTNHFFLPLTSYQTCSTKGYTIPILVKVNGSSIIQTPIKIPHFIFLLKIFKGPMNFALHVRETARK